MKRFCSWIVMLLEIPVVAAVFSVVYVGVKYVADWISAHWMVEALTEDINLGELIMLPLLGLLLAGFARLSGKICQSRKGGRIRALMIVSLLCGLFFVYCRIKGELPFKTPFEVSKGMLTGAAVSLIANAWWCFLDIRRFKKAEKEMVEKIKKDAKAVTVFCYLKQGDTKLTPYAYIEGGPGLVHEGVTPALPERDGQGFDRNLFERMMDKVVDGEFRGSDVLRHSQFVISGYHLDGKAVFPYIVSIHEDGRSYTYADMVHPQGNEKPRVMNLTVEEIRKTREIKFDFSNTAAAAKPAAAVKPAAPAKPAAAAKPAERMSESRIDLIREIEQYTGYAIFQASHRLNIDLHDQCDNFRKLEVPQLQQMLRDLRAHAKK